MIDTGDLDLTVGRTPGGPSQSDPATMHDGEAEDENLPLTSSSSRGESISLGRLPPGRQIDVETRRRSLTDYLVDYVTYTGEFKSDLTLGRTPSQSDRGLMCNDAEVEDENLVSTSSWSIDNIR